MIIQQVLCDHITCKSSWMAIPPASHHMWLVPALTVTERFIWTAQIAPRDPLAFGKIMLHFYLRWKMSLFVIERVDKPQNWVGGYSYVSEKVVRTGSFYPRTNILFGYGASAHFPSAWGVLPRIQAPWRHEFQIDSSVFWGRCLGCPHLWRNPMLWQCPVRLPLFVWAQGFRPKLTRFSHVSPQGGPCSGPARPSFPWFPQRGPALFKSFSKSCARS